MNTRRFVVIIPAHNEETVIIPALRSLLDQLERDDTVVVVCNGCTDDTAAIVRGVDASVCTLEIPVASKSAALNCGDKYCSGHFRLYMDADVVVGEGALRKLRDALSSGKWLAVSPEPRMDFCRSSWAVRAYYSVWLSLPYCKKGMIGSGVYALSESGRARFEKFPDIIADDGYVRALFEEHERGMVEGAISIVKAPANLYWLIKIKTRSRIGKLELASRFPDLLANEVKDYSGGALDLFRRPVKWPSGIVYLYVNMLSRLLARRGFSSKKTYKWEKDHSSRSDDKEHS